MATMYSEALVEKLSDFLGLPLVICAGSVYCTSDKQAVFELNGKSFRIPFVLHAHVLRPTSVSVLFKFGLRGLLLVSAFKDSQEIQVDVIPTFSIGYNPKDMFKFGRPEDMRTLFGRDSIYSADYRVV